MKQWCFFMFAEINRKVGQNIHTADSQQPTGDDSGGNGYDAIVIRVLQGSLGDLPPIPSKTVRIFLSSTFSGKQENMVT